MKSSFGKGLSHGIPIALGYFSVSFGFGIMAVQSGLQAIEAIVISLTNLTSAGQAAGVTNGDEVITTPITFAASANCALYCGAKPVFADINDKTYNIDPKKVKEVTTEKTKAVVAVDFTGQSVELDKLMAHCKENNLVLIEDGAHVIGTKYKGQPNGSIADMTTFSFHPVKHITTGEGGMILTNNEELYKKLVLFRTHGITRDAEQMLKNEGAWYYEQLDLGYNYRMTDIQCALGISQMKRLDEFLAKRRALVKHYDEAFKGVEGIVTPFMKAECNSSWHLYVIQVEERKEVFDKLRAAGIGVNVHYIPVHKHPYYQANGYADVVCEKAEELYKHMISLPLYPDLMEDEQDYVIEKVIEAIK